jgi:parvulin-like peptidyl-prolyl isomerase
MLKSLFIILCLFVTGSLVFAEDGIVAVVNNDVITQKDLNDFINFMRMQMYGKYSEEEIEQRINLMLPDLISRLIEDRLILQAAYKEDIIVDQIRIEARIEQIKKQYSTEADFEQALASQGSTLADIELKIKEQLLMFGVIDREIESKIVVTPQEITDYYNAHSTEFKKPGQRLVRFLIIEDSMAKDAESLIAESKDLDAIADSLSLEVTDLGWVDSSKVREEIAEIVFKSEVGKISTLLSSEGKNYVLEVKAIKPPQEQSLFEVQEVINRILFEKKMQEAMVEWLGKLRSEAYIEIKPDL